MKRKRTMPKFTVKFVAYSRFEAEFEVEADSVEEAEEIALENGEDSGYTWVPDSDYWDQKVLSTEKVK
jgi:hypothetical protein